MHRRTLALLLSLIVLVGLAVPATATPAQELPPPEGSGAETQIVGGTQVPDGQFPWTAALIRRGSGRQAGFSCTASVLSRSWAITAGHCVLDYYEEYPDSTYGNYVAPSHFDLLTGTQSLVDGAGQRLQVAAIYPHPDYDFVYSDHDLALVRLARPTSAPEIAVIGSSAPELALDDPGADAFVAGWGVTYSGGSSAEDELRYVDVEVQSDATCSNAYPIGFTDPQYPDYPLEYHSSNMLCAGPLSGGKDSCQGDSGGPLAIDADPSGAEDWRLIGAVSFGYGCADPGYPGVYQRLTASASWIGRTRRFGPFNPDAFAYVHQQYADFAGRFATSSELNLWRSHLASNPAADLPAYLQESAAWDGNAGMNTRLYRAAFLRNPDTSGLDYWVRRRWAGRGPVSIANHFTASSEFQTKYGSLSNDGFITRIYQNVFERDPDPGGRAYWNKKLASGVGRGQMLYELSNSSEYRRDTATLVRIITTRYGLLRQVPSAGEITTSEALTQRSLIDTLRTSYRYAARFNG